MTEIIQHQWSEEPAAPISRPDSSGELPDWIKESPVLAGILDPADYEDRINGRIEPTTEPPEPTEVPEPEPEPEPAAPTTPELPSAESQQSAFVLPETYGGADWGQAPSALVANDVTVHRVQE